MNSFSVRTKIMEGGGLETLAPKLHKVFIVTDGFMASSGKVSYITEKLDRAAQNIACSTRSRQTRISVR